MTLRSIRPVLAFLLAACLLAACAGPLAPPQPDSILISGAVPYRDLDDLIADADVIAIGSVTEIEPSRWNTENGKLPPGASPVTQGLNIISDSTFEVSQLLKGEVDSSSLSIRSYGGTLDGVTLWVEDQVWLEAGPKYLLFLMAFTDGPATDLGPRHYYVLEGDPGIFTIADGKATALNDEWRLTDLVAYIQAAPTPWASPGVGAYLLRRYEAFDVPIVSVEVTQENPLAVEVTWRTSASGEQGSPDDPIYSHIVHRELALASLQGYEIDSYAEFVINRAGEQVAASSGSGLPPLDNWAMDTTPARLNDHEVDLLLNDGRLDLHGLDSHGLSVESLDGLQGVLFSLWTPSVDTANQSVPTLIASLRPQVEALNAEGAHIVSYHVEVWDADSNMLLNYICDLRTASQSWWMTDGMIGGWYPEPAPPLPEGSPASQ